MPVSPAAADAWHLASTCAPRLHSNTRMEESFHSRWAEFHVHDVVAADGVTQDVSAQQLKSASLIGEGERAGECQAQRSAAATVSETKQLK